MHAHIHSSPLDGLDCLARNIKNKVKDEKWRARLLFFFFLEEVIVFVHCSFLSNVFVCHWSIRRRKSG